jgi:VanZ family protein
MKGPAAYRKLCRVGFVCFAVVLFTMTHWPALKVRNVVPRSDLWIHASAFTAWTLLCILASLFDTNPLSRRNILLSMLAGVAYAGFDELTQAIPILHRTCAWDDFFADALGVVIAGVVAILLSRKARASADTSAHTKGA